MEKRQKQLMGLGIKTGKVSGKAAVFLVKKIAVFIGIPGCCFVIFLLVLVASVDSTVSSLGATLSTQETQAETPVEETEQENSSGVKGGLTTKNSKKVIETAKAMEGLAWTKYKHKCELWCYHVYRTAGLSYNGACCARAHRDKCATKSGDIPVGALIYSGNNYRSRVTCMCGRNAGHVAIYMGNDTVIGAQSPTRMTLAQWTKLFGYGGWSSQ